MLCFDSIPNSFSCLGILYVKLVSRTIVVFPSSSSGTDHEPFLPFTNQSRGWPFLPLLMTLHFILPEREALLICKSNIDKYIKHIHAIYVIQVSLDDPNFPPLQRKRILHAYDFMLLWVGMVVHMFLHHIRTYNLGPKGDREDRDQRQLREI